MINKEYIVKQLKKNIPSDIFNFFKENNVMLAGGALTSILTNKPINDYDLYFKSKKDVLSFLAEVKENDWLPSYTFIFTCATDKSISFRSNSFGESLIQLIHQGYYKDLYAVFSDFDFTINMIGYDFAEDEVYYHQDAMQHLAQRILVTDGGTKFPLVSVLRAAKYEDRGYKISKKEMVKLLLQVSAMNLTSYEEVAKHIGGMYGLKASEVFDESKPFSIVECINQLSTYEFDDLARDSSQIERRFELFYESFVYGVDVDKLPYVKFVRYKDGELSSFYDRKFKYVVGEEVVAKRDGIFGDGGIYCGKMWSELQYQHNNNSVMLILEPTDKKEQPPFLQPVKVVAMIEGVNTEKDYIQWLSNNGYVSVDFNSYLDEHKDISL